MSSLFSVDFFKETRLPMCGKVGKQTLDMKIMFTKTQFQRLSFFCKSVRLLNLLIIKNNSVCGVLVFRFSRKMSSSGYTCIRTVFCFVNVLFWVSC